jgi:hypothetical protein
MLDRAMWAAVESPSCSSGWIACVGLVSAGWRCVLRRSPTTASGDTRPLRSGARGSSVTETPDRAVFRRVAASPRCGSSARKVSLTTSAIARMNLFLHDIEDARILRGDTLRDPKFRDEHGRLARFDVVITDPPFSLTNWGADFWANDPWGRPVCGVPPAGSGDFAWEQHMLASMDPNHGRLGVDMPHGVLFRGGAEGAIRECLVKGACIGAARLDAGAVRT